MTGFPLPRFSYHEALLIGDFFLQDFAFLELRNEPKPSDEEGLEELAEEFRKTPRYQKTYTYVEKALGRFKKFLDSLKTAGTYLHDVDKVALVQKLEELNESQRVQLYFAVTRYYWTDGTESQAEALCRAGLVDKQQIGTAKALEHLDRRLRAHERHGIKFPFLGRGGSS